jgi:hypothetical protein
LCATDIAVIEGEGIAACRWFPTKTRLCESTFACLFGEVKVDAIEAFPGLDVRLRHGNEFVVVDRKKFEEEDGH